MALEDIGYFMAKLTLNSNPIDKRIRLLKKCMDALIN